MTATPRAIELVREDDGTTGTAGGEPGTEATSDLSDAADELTADHADADWIARGGDDTDGAQGEESGPEEADRPDQEPAQPRGRRKRSSVPSWDEIMFGGGGSGAEH